MRGQLRSNARCVIALYDTDCSSRESWIENLTGQDLVVVLVIKSHTILEDDMAIKDGWAFLKCAFGAPGNPSECMVLLLLDGHRGSGLFVRKYCQKAKL